jgi:ABC-2 type transport system ATP-binding protein
MSGTPLIEAQHLSKSFRVLRKKTGALAGLRTLFSTDYQEVPAVNDVNFTIAPGELVGYIGPNGAGKSTTIKMLTGVLHPSGGRAIVSGLVPYQQRAQNSRQIGVVFGQRTQLIYDLPARDTFELLRKMYTVPQARFTERVAYFSDLLDLGALLDRPVRLLSLGERMRCELIAALLHAPRIIFLDEPTIGLDVVAKERMRTFITTLNQEQGTTILLTTHDLHDIEQLCRRVIIIDHGTVIYDGTLAEIKRRYGRRRRITFALLDGAAEANGRAAAPLTVERLDAELVALGDSITVEQREDRSLAVGFNPQRVAVSALTRHIVNRYPVADLTVEEADLEAIIREIYASGTAEVADGRADA